MTAQCSSRTTDLGKILRVSHRSGFVTLSSIAPTSSSCTPKGTTLSPFAPPGRKPRLVSPPSSQANTSDLNFSHTSNGSGASLRNTNPTLLSPWEELRPGPSLEPQRLRKYEGLPRIVRWFQHSNASRRTIQQLYFRADSTNFARLLYAILRKRSARPRSLRS